MPAIMEHDLTGSEVAQGSEVRASETLVQDDLGTTATLLAQQCTLSTVGPQDLPVLHLVLDANAFFNAASLNRLGGEQKVSYRYYTVPEVVKEIRDVKSKQTLLQGPLFAQLCILSPSLEAMEAVTIFSKKTGDFASLSLPDLKILALTWMLEREKVGNTNHLRVEPVRVQTRTGGGPRPAPAPQSKIKPDPVQFSSDTTLESCPGLDGTASENVQIRKSNGMDEHHSAMTEEPMADKTEEVKEGLKVKEADDDDDDEGWITPKNFEMKQQQHCRQSGRKLDANSLSITSLLPVACMTSDFAMQNVLLMLNLKLISPDQKTRITRLKNWVLRCHACYKISKDMTKKFCPSCGNATLIRTSVSVDGEGNMTLYLKRNFQYNNRGTVYDIPKPTGGRNSKDIILREDQREYEMAMRKHKSKNAKAGMDVFGLDSWEEDKKRSVPSGITIGHGRKNVNERRKSRK